MTPSAIALLNEYVRHFSSRDFDSLRGLLAKDVMLDVVGALQARGANQVGGYFIRYSQLEGWNAKAGSVNVDTA
jgi:RNA polymerase sigma-70 factor (ECF subfamily)